MQNITRKVAAISDSLKEVEKTLKNVNLEDAENFATINSFDYPDLAFRFLINFIAIFILIRVIYYNTHKNKDFLFTFFLFNLLNFSICILLSTAKIKMGFAFGLFAIFSIMRYRTVTVPIKEMGYLFTCVALGLINSMAFSGDYYEVIIICNAFVLGLTLILDRFISLQHENVKEITYERIDLILPEKRQELLEDLNSRTGLNIHRVEIRNINFLRDSANIFAYYFAKENESSRQLENDLDD
ncbi:MAG: DUF4956 domain-containing protein [Chitinophagaceae bacterium]|nr:DUF4956 domain-containing protein [Chitinophagaceae bacterium]